jgi:CheY-like chemotaxis protein
MITQEENQTTLKPDTPLPNRQPSRSGCVLLAEDDQALRRYLEVVLQRAGYRVIAARDGVEAIKAAVTSSIDVVVTDAVMPNLDGNELCRFFRSSPNLSGIPIVLLSALERREDPKTQPVDAFLAKPVSPDDLLVCLDGLLANCN